MVAEEEVVDAGMVDDGDRSDGKPKKNNHPSHHRRILWDQPLTTVHLQPAMTAHQDHQVTVVLLVALEILAPLEVQDHRDQCRILAPG